MAENHANAKELWVRIHKPASGKPSVAWTDCVVELNKQNLFSMYYRLHSAKTAETRAKRMAQILSMLEKETKLR